MEKIAKNVDDPYKWSLETAAALRAGDFSRIDMEELICEVESLASGLRRELVMLLTDALEGLLVSDYVQKPFEDPEKQLVHAQSQLQLVLYSARSLQEILPEAVVKAYGRARDMVAKEYGVALPEVCPFPLERITEDPFDRVMAKGRVG
jgi:hypothetical protein